MYRLVWICGTAAALKRSHISRRTSRSGEPGDRWRGGNARNPVHSTPNLRPASRLLKSESWATPEGWRLQLSFSTEGSWAFVDAAKLRHLRFSLSNPIRPLMI